MINQNEEIEILLSEVDENEYSANVEDSVTFERLQEQLNKYGLLDRSSVRPLRPDESKPGKRWKVIHGRHRLAALQASGETKAKVILVDTPFEPEEEFNLVNNMNLVHGDSNKRDLVKIIRTHKLDPTKVDLFKLPTDLLMPSIEPSDLLKHDKEIQRSMAIQKLTLEIAKQLAQIMQDEKDDLISFLVVEDRVAAVLRIPFNSGESGARSGRQMAREKATMIKGLIKKAIEEAAELPTIQDPGDQYQEDNITGEQE